MNFSFQQYGKPYHLDRPRHQKTPLNLEIRGRGVASARSVANSPPMQDASDSQDVEDNDAESTPPSWPDTPPGDSGTYRDVRDLSRCLWEKARFDAQAKDAEQKRPATDELWDDSVTLLSRWHLAEHPSRQPPLCRHRNLDQAVFETPMDGLRPEMSLEAEKQRLKREEAALLVRRWQEVWETVRPPAPYWYELRTPDFTYEARRAIEIDSSPARQRMEAHVRNQIMDLHRTVAMDRRLTASRASHR